MDGGDCDAACWAKRVVGISRTKVAIAEERTGSISFSLCAFALHPSIRIRGSSRVLARERQKGTQAEAYATGGVKSVLEAQRADLVQQSFVGNAELFRRSRLVPLRGFER